MDSPYLYYSLSFLAITLGLFLTLFNLPGVWFVFGGIVLTEYFQGFEKLSLFSIALFFGLSVLASFLDNITLALGGRRFGATKWGILGALIGGFVGAIFGNIPGLFFGAFFGAVAFELVFAGRESRDAVKAGFGSLLGLVLGLGLKLMLVVGMVIAWLMMHFR